MTENSSITVSGSTLGTALEQILMCDEIQPGSEASYQMCKTLYLFHPLGVKMAEAPITMAMSQAREISVANSPEGMVKEAFERAWKDLDCDRHIFNTMSLSRVYGVASIVYGAQGVPSNRPIDPKAIPDLDLYFNVLDPLNTAGSLVLNQDPNSPNFLKPDQVSVSGQTYHRSRSCVIMNENPIFIGYTNSAFGYVGRSTYQRALFPLKTFVQSMVTDDMVTKKAGVLVAKMKGAGSIVDRTMQVMTGLKRNLLKEAKTNNVISVGHEDSIESLDMRNADTAMTVARKNCLENCAVAASMPAKILNSESFAEGFGEGTEDAKDIVRYVNKVRKDMAPLYAFFDPIVMRRAWSPEFYKTVQAEFSEYEKVPYLQAFYAWANAFKATWPNLIEEPASEKAKVDDIKFKAVVALLEVLMPSLDPENKARMVEWACDCASEQKELFSHPLILDIDELRNYVPPTPEAAASEPTPFSGES